MKGNQEVVERYLSIPNKWGKLIISVKVIGQAFDENGEEIILIGAGELAK